MLEKIRKLKQHWAREALAESADDLSNDSSKPIVWVLGVLAILIAAAVLWPYFHVFGGELSRVPQDWANFGSYVGGVAGPLFALVSLVAFLITVRQQAYLSALSEKRAREEEHLRALSGYLDELQRLENMCIAVDTTLGDLFAASDDFPEVADSKRLQRILEGFVDTLFRYSEMVAMHRENNRPLWDVTYYKNRGLWALKSLVPYYGRLNPLKLQAIEHHLNDSWPKPA